MDRLLSVRPLAVILLAPLLMAAAHVQLDDVAADVPAWEINGARYYDLSALCGGLNIKQTDNPRTTRTTLAHGTSRLVAAPDMPEVLIDGRVYRLSSPPRVILGRLAVPDDFLTVLSELLGKPVRIASFESDPLPDIEDVRAALKPGAIIRVMLDPGHGGHDSGAVGPDGQMEKEVVLVVALMAKPIIERELGCEVMLTRSTDVFVPLASRTRMANLWGADLFVSIHANGARRVEATGVETYYLSMTASDSEAAAMAADENAVLALEGGPSPEALSDLQAIMWDMVQTEVLRASADVAELAQYRLAEASPSPNRGVKQAPFFVLIGSQMPSILVEIGFITNPDEAVRLCDELVQLDLARAIAAAVVDYDAKLRGER